MYDYVPGTQSVGMASKDLTNGIQVPGNCGSPGGIAILKHSSLQR